MEPIGLLEAWVRILVANSLLSVVVLAGVLVVTRGRRRRAPAVHVALWSLVLIRLVLPPDLGHPFAVGALVDRVAHREVEGHPVTGPEGSEGTLDFQGMHDGIRDDPGGELDAWMVAAAAFWLTGFLAAGALRVRRLGSVRRVLEGARLAVDPELLAVCHAWSLRLGVRRRVRVMTSDSGMTPFTVGIVRPIIYLPRPVLGNPRCLEAAVAHEMAHVARFDALWLGLQHLVQTVYFFNPVVWLAGARLNGARETLCDATVVAANRLSATEYVRGLLGVLRLELHDAGAPAMTARKRRIGVRILTIFDHEGARRPSLGAAMLLATFLGIFLLPLSGGGADAVAVPAAVAPEIDTTRSTGDQVDFANPLPEGRITWSWGPGHLDPFSHKEVSHRGIDLAAASGTPVVAPGDGLVRVATEAYVISPSSGTVILIDHENGFETFFAHLESLEVVEGQRVEKGMVIATVGSTGRSTGPHLHFEILRDGEAVNPADFVAEWN